MKKIVLLITLAATLAALWIAPAGAQVLLATIKGKVTDETGPMVGVKVEYYEQNTGRKYTLTTDKKGEYFSLGVQDGVYRVTLSKDGQAVWTQDNVHVSISAPDGINEENFNLPELRAAAMSKPGQAALTVEQVKKIEEKKKENLSIEALNEKLAAAKAAQDAQNWDQAVAILTEATSLDPTRHELWASLCVAELGGKKFEDAGVHCQKAITLAERQPTPDNVKLAKYHNNLGQAYAKTGKTQEALAEYTTAAQADPASAATYYFNLGAVLTNESARQQDQAARFHLIDRATEAFEKAIAADPSYAEAYYQKAVNLLGKATLDKNNKMVAPPGTAEAFNKYLELEPTGRHAEEVKGMLAYIGAEVQTSYGKSRTKK
ncbi:MAG: carboxypeptidase regulatory-like domain-containing protein [Terriglobales bacterium]